MGTFGHIVLAIYQIVRRIYEAEASMTCRRHSAQDTQGLRFGGAVVLLVFEDMSGIDGWVQPNNWPALLCTSADFMKQKCSAQNDECSSRHEHLDKRAASSRQG